MSPDRQETISHLERRLLELREQGDYAGIAEVLEQSPAPTRFREALAAARAEMGAGRVRSARRWLEAAKALEPTPEERTLLDLESAQGRVLEELDLRTGLAAARRAEEQLAALSPDPSASRTVVEARLAILRLRFMATRFGELPNRCLPALLRELPDPEALRESRRVELALQVAFLAASFADDREAPALWDRMEQLALQEGRPASAGEALLGKTEALLRQGTPETELLEILRRAEGAFREADHRHGPVDCDRWRGKIRLERWGGSPRALEACISRYLEAGYPKGALSTLLDLSVEAHRRGDRSAALAFRQRIDELADELGFGMTRKLEVFTHADLALRERLDARGRDLCDAALAEGLPPAMEAGLLTLRGSALSLAGDPEGAIADRRRALEIFEALDREQDASELVRALVSDLASSRSETDLARADELLVHWIERDRERPGPEALAEELLKETQRAELRALGVLGRRNRSAGHPGTPGPPGDPGARGPEDEGLTDAERRLAAVRERIPEEARGRAWGTLIGSLCHVEGLVASLRGRDDALEAATLRALEQYEHLGLGFEAANAHYLLGCLELNRANSAPGAGFAEPADAAEGHLIRALELYERTGGMRHRAAETRHKLAMLYLNVQHRMPQEVALGLRHLAEEHLEDAATTFDELRRAFSSRDRLEAFTGKAQLSAEAAQVVGEALRLHLSLAPQPERAWEWVARSKAQALDELLGAEARIPASLEARIAGDEDLAALVSKERELAERLATAPAARRLEIEEELDSLRAAMGEHPPLREYVALRTGASAGPADLAAVAAAAPEPFALVDWVFQGRQVHLLVSRPGEEPYVERLPLDREAIQAFVANELSARSFRMTLKDDPASLRTLDALVAPLSWSTKPDETLILCPSGPLHAVPLHALEVDGGPLMARNPVSYTPSLAVLRLCCQPGVDRDTSSSSRVAEGARAMAAAVLGDPTRDRPEAEAVARRIAAALGVSPILGASVTADRIESALAGSEVLHFQGHALHDPKDPLSSRLELAGGERFEARRLFALRHLEARLISLGACQSAASVVRDGDEQLGLIPALLVAGARTVVAAGWRVEERSAARFMERYFQELVDGALPHRALRTAALAVRTGPDGSAPYYWGAYTLHGSPWQTLTRHFPATEEPS